MMEIKLCLLFPSSCWLQLNVNMLKDIVWFLVNRFNNYLAKSYSLLESFVSFILHENLRKTCMRWENLCFLLVNFISWLCSYLRNHQYWVVSLSLQMPWSFLLEVQTPCPPAFSPTNLFPGLSFLCLIRSRKNLCQTTLWWNVIFRRIFPLVFRVLVDTDELLSQL